MSKRHFMLMVIVGALPDMMNVTGNAKLDVEIGDSKNDSGDRLVSESVIDGKVPVATMSLWMWE